MPAAPEGQTDTAFAGGGDHSLALTRDGRVFSWGDNSNQETEVPAAPAGQTYTAVAAGNGYSLALTSEGRVVGWGYDGGGGLDIPAELR